MSVVKKHKTGGKVDYSNEYEQFLAEKLNENSFTAKSLPIARQVASKWLKAYKGGNWENIYQSDPVSGKYGINKEGLPEELKNEIWEGSSDQIKTNMLGQFNARPDGSNRGEGDDGVIKKYNTLLANWTDEFHRSKKSATTTAGTQEQKGEASIKDLDDHILNTTFKGKQGAWDEQTELIKDNDTMKAWVMEQAVGNLDAYKKDQSEDNLKKFNFTGIDPAIENNIREAQRTGNWELFGKNARLLGWETERLLKQEPKEDVEAKQKAYQEGLLKNNITNPEIANFLTSGEYELDPTNTFENAPEWLPGWLTKNKALLFKNKYNQRAIVQNNKFLDKTFNDPDDPTYGTYFSHNNGILDFQTPGTETWDKTKFPNIGGQVYGKRMLQGTVPGYEGWSIEGLPTGQSGSFDKDQLSNTDYTKHLILRDPSNSRDMVELFKDLDGNYKDVSGKLLEGVDLNQYGDFNALDLSQLIGENDIYTKLGEKKSFENFEQTEDAVNKIMSDGISVKDIELIANIISDIRYRIKNANNETERENALKYYKYLLEGENIPEDVKKKVLNVDTPFTTSEKIAAGILLPAVGGLATSIHNKVKYGKWRKGGAIVKALKGISVEDYLKEVGEQNKAKAEKAQAPIKSNIGTLRDWTNQSRTNKALDIASGLGTAGMFIPGYGAIGGGVMTAAELAKDIMDGDGEIHWGQHAMNLGFTGLSLVGLGGLKGVATAGKVITEAGKVVDVGMDLAKVGSKAEIYGKAINSIKPVEAINRLKKIGSVEEAGKLITKLEGKLTGKAALSAEDYLKLKKLRIGKGVKGLIKNGKPIEATKIAESLKSDVALAKKIIDLGKNAPKYTDKFGKLTGKIAPWMKTAAGTVAVASAIPSIGGVVSDVNEGGFGNIHTADLENIALSAAIAGRWVNSARKTKLMGKYTKPLTSKDGSITLTGGEKDVLLTNKVKLPGKEVAGVKKFVVSDEKKIAKFRKALEDQKVDKTIIDDLIKNRNELDWKIVNSEKSGLQMNNERLLEPGASLKEFEKARKIFEGKYLFKEGGIMKFQKPASGIKRDPSYSTQWSWTNYPQSSYKKPDYSLFNLATKKNPVKLEEDPVHKNAIDKSKAWQTAIDNQSVSQSQPQPKIKHELVEEPRSILSLDDSELPTELQSGNNEPLNITRPTFVNSGDTGVDNKEGFKLNKLGKYLDSETLSNTLMYLNTLRSNSSIAKSQIRALGENIYNTPTVPNQYLRINSPNSPFYDTQARKMEGLGKRIQESTSDWDKGVAARLGANKQAGELREKGNQADLQSIQQGIDKQIGVNRQTELANNQIVSKNIMRNADVRSKIPLVGANKTLANNTALNNYLLALQKTKDTNEVKGRYKALFDSITDPKYKEAQDKYSEVLKNMSEAKKNWKPGILPGSSIKESSWEDSNTYKNFNSELENLTKALEDFRYKTYTAQTAASMMMKKGGTLEEKEYLLRLKENFKKEREEEKQFYKSILANNEMMRKSLIKIFK